MPDLHLDASLGAAGDMLLAALVDAGADPQFVVRCVTAVAPEAVVAFEDTVRCGLRAARALVSATGPSAGRTWASIRSDLAEADLPPAVRDRSLAVFANLAEAEAQVHGTDVESVHFHEVGALDSIVDIVGGCAALDSLQPDRITCGPVATGSGYADTRHGRIPLPSPALVAVLSGTGARLTAGPADFEACTPTAAALLATWTDEWTRGPELHPTRIGVGAGTADPAGHPNVTRVLLGSAGRHATAPQGTAQHATAPQGTAQHATAPHATAPHATAPVEGAQDGTAPDGGAGTADAAAPHPTSRSTGPRPADPGAAVLLETNIDDLDPRLWPEVLRQLLGEGAADAWLSPILMKKGRPAHTLHVLCRAGQADALAEQVMRHTSAIGMRVLPCGKIAAERSMAEVSVAGHPVRIKVATFAGRVVNVQPEWEDVRAAADATGLPAKEVLALAHAGAAGLWRSSPPQ